LKKEKKMKRFQGKGLLGILMGLSILTLSSCGKELKYNNETGFVKDSQHYESDESNDSIEIKDDNEKKNSTISNIVETEEKINDDDELTDTISNTSKIGISNILSDGRIWAVEDNGQTIDIVLLDVYGNVYNRLSADLYSGYLVCGIDSVTVVFSYNDEISIYNIETNENMTDSIVKDFDFINEILWIDDEPIFSVKKKVESFSEEYLQYKLVDRNGNKLFDISLDEATLKTYGIQKSYNIQTDHDMHLHQLTDDLYYIPYVGGKYNGLSELNSLLIDVKNNKVTPVSFPSSNGTIYASSDGGITSVFVPMKGEVLINNDTGESMRFPSDDYAPVGIASEGKISATGHQEQWWAIFDMQGNLLIDLNNYGHVVRKAYEFHNDACLIEFIDDYVSFIDTNGSFLFEPVKGSVRLYDKKHNMAIIDDINNNQVFILDINGNQQIFEGIVPTSFRYFYVSYGGETYWIRGSLDEGLKMYHMM